MSIPHIITERKNIFPSQRTSKQTYQTRHVQKKGSKINTGPKTQNTDSSIIPLIPSRDRQGPPQSPVLPPKETSPLIPQGSPARLFPNGVLYASSHSADSSDRSHPAHNPPASPPENPRTP